MSIAFQDQINGITCFGCGPSNPLGLRIKSHWCEERAALCTFVPGPCHNGPPNIVSGGIIATVIDCHAVCTAIADAHRRVGRAIGEGPLIPYVTGTLTVRFVAPTPMGVPLEVRAEITDVTERKTTLACTVIAAGRLTVEAEVIAVKPT